MATRQLSPEELGEYPTMPSTRQLTDAELEIEQQLEGFAPASGREEPVEEENITAVTYQAGNDTILYRVSTGEPVEILGGMVGMALASRDVAGLPVFSRTLVEPRYRNVVLCGLHPNHPERGKWDLLNLEPCSKDNLKNENELRRHMEVKHRSAWPAMKEMEAREERVLDRQLARANLDAMQAIAKGQMDIAAVSGAVPGHTHNYVKGSTSGAPCQVEGCTHIKEPKNGESGAAP